MSDYYIKKIEKINFGLLSPEDIRKMSVVTVEYPDTYGDDGFPIEKGLMDSRMGIIDPSFVCGTCGFKGGDCPGHFGSIELARPVIHVGFGDVIHKILRSTCNDCGRILLNDEQIEFYGERIREAMGNKESINNILKDVYKSAKRELKTMPEDDEEIDLKYCCPHCGAPQEAIILDKPVTIRQGDYKLTPSEVRERLEKITDEDAFILGVNSEVARPEWLVLTVLPVPPVTVRPSITLDTGERSEDDLTHKLVDILRINQRLLENMEAGAPQLIVEDLWELLQYHVTTYFDNEASGVPPARHRSGRPLKTLMQRLTGHEKDSIHERSRGRFRDNLSGKYVNFSARTVISPDPNISINEVGVPEMIAKEVTVPVYVNEWNIDEMRSYIENGPNIHPGANFVRNGNTKRRVSESTKGFISDRLEPGFIIDRHLKDGDVVLFNRQPSLHKMSIMAHDVKVLPYKTFRLNPAVCPPYNANFNGDEMNMHILQTDESRAEAKSLMHVQENIMSPRFGGPIIGAIEDFISGAYLLTRDGVEFTEEEALQIIRKSHLPIPPFKSNQWVLKYDPDFDEDTFLFKDKGDKWTGKELFSLLLPNDLNLQYGAEIAKGKSEITEVDEETGLERIIGYEGIYPAQDGYVVIKNGIITQGAIDESAYGSFSGKILDKIVKEYGPGRAKEFLDRSTDLAICGIMKTGITTSLNDEEIPEEAQDRINEHLNKKMEEVDMLVQSYEEGYLQALPGRSLEETLEMKIMQVLGEARDMSGSIAENYLTMGKQYPEDPYDHVMAVENHSVVMARTGTRASMLNLTQITACVGQQAVRGGRIERGYLNRTLPHFKKGDLGVKAKGFVHSSYKSGLDPIEFFFHAMGGRGSLVDATIYTGASGYMQRRLVNALQDVTVKSSGFVIDNQGNVIQTLYGEDGVDPAKSDFGKPADLNKLIDEIRTKNKIEEISFARPHKLNGSKNSDNLSVESINQVFAKNILNKIKITLDDYEVFMEQVHLQLAKLDGEFASEEQFVEIVYSIQIRINGLKKYQEKCLKLDNFDELLEFLDDSKNDLKNLKKRFNIKISEINSIIKNNKLDEFNQLINDAEYILEENISDYSNFDKKVSQLLKQTNKLSSYVEKQPLINNLDEIKSKANNELDKLYDIEHELLRIKSIHFKHIDDIDNEINYLKILIEKLNNYESLDLGSTISEQEIVYKNLLNSSNNIDDKNIDLLLKNFNKCIKSRIFKRELRKYNLKDDDLIFIQETVKEEIISQKISDENTDFKIIIKARCDEYQKSNLSLDDEELDKLLGNVNVSNVNPEFTNQCKIKVKNDLIASKITKNDVELMFKNCINKKKDESIKLKRLDEIKNNAEVLKIRKHLSQEENEEIYQIVENKIRSEYGLNESVLVFVENLTNKKIKLNQSDARNTFNVYKRDLIRITQLNSQQIGKFNKQIEFLISRNKIKSGDFSEEFLIKVSDEFINSGKIIL